MGDEQVEFENEKVRVLRVRMTPGAQHKPQARGDRVLVWLTQAHHVRTDTHGHQEDIRRRPGEVAWRGASHHEIEAVDDAHELIIVEFK